MRNWSESLRNWFEGLASGYAVDHLLYLRSASFEVNVEFTLTHASSRHSEERPSKASFPLSETANLCCFSWSKQSWHPSCFLSSRSQIRSHPSAWGCSLPALACEIMAGRNGYSFQAMYCAKLTLQTLIQCQSPSKAHADFLHLREQGETTSQTQYVAKASLCLSPYFNAKKLPKIAMNS